MMYFIVDCKCRSPQDTGVERSIPQPQGIPVLYPPTSILCTHADGYHTPFVCCTLKTALVHLIVESAKYGPAVYSARHSTGLVWHANNQAEAVSYYREWQVKKKVIRICLDRGKPRHSLHQTMVYHLHPYLCQRCLLANHARISARKGRIRLSITQQHAARTHLTLSPALCLQQ